MPIDLEPCPFCGSEAIETRDTETKGGTYVWHVCASCGCETEGADGHQDAADQWNTRAPTAAARERDALRAQMEIASEALLRLSVGTERTFNASSARQMAASTTAIASDAVNRILAHAPARQSISPNAGEPK